MAKKPTYKELEQRVRELEEEYSKRKRAEEALRQSEERYRSFVDDLGDVAYTTDTQGNVTYANKMAETITGESLEDIVGKPFLPFFTQGSQQMAIDVYQRTLNGESPEYELTLTSGRTGYFKNAALTDKNGKIIGVFGIARDITDRKRAEEALRQSENKYRTLLEHLPQKIFHKDKDSVYVACNENYARDLNIKPEEIKGKTDYDFFPKKLTKKYRADDKKIIMSGATRDIEEKYMQDGREVWVHTVKTPVKDKRGNTTGVLGIFWDITKEKLARKKLRKREAALKIQANELKELNSALRVLLKRRDEDKAELEEKVAVNVKELVLAYTEKLKKSRLDAKQMAYLNIIESNLNEIISPFAHKLSSRYANLTPRQIQLADLVKQGQTAKEIAELFNVSKRTIDGHMGSIRKKLGIKNTKVNLRAHLLSLG
jgi:PAS domain S-box-containing protein